MRVPAKPISLDDALEMTRTGDVWLFRGRAVADRAIQMSTNSPINHVGMSVALDDLPPLMWHAELGRSLPDLWAGGHHRGESGCRMNHMYGGREMSKMAVGDLLGGTPVTSVPRCAAVSARQAPGRLVIARSW